MNADIDLDRTLKEKELERIESEIERNRAERDRHLSAQRHSWAPYFVALIAAVALTATFVGFFADLYSIAVTDRAENRRQNDTLTKENASLRNRNHALEESKRVSDDLSKQLELALTSLMVKERESWRGFA